MALLFLAFVASGATVVGAEVGTSQAATCTGSPTSVALGEPVELDASGVDGKFVEFDKQGNGEYTISDETDFVAQATYNETGTYQPRVRVDGDPDRVADCGTVTVEAQNQPPEPVLSVSPRPGTVGQPATFDASDSTDPDGTIVAYRWDFDGNGTIDAETSSATTTHTYGETSVYAPRVTVVDDDNATAVAETTYDVLEPLPEPQARCTVEPTTVTPGGELTIDARESANAFAIEYDTDGDGTFETERDEFVLTTSYDEPGTYAPRVRVSGELGSDTADCGEVVVRAPNESPEATLTVSLRPGTVGQSTVFDASDSTDPDGEIVEYRWDFDGDTTVEETTTTATAEFTFDTADSYVPRVTVVDDDGATASASADYTVREPPEPQARCSVDPTAVAPGDVVVIDARESANAFGLESDVDGDGTYERETSERRLIETSYDEPGTYEPAIRVSNEFGSDTADCGEVVVEAPNEPPEAALTVSPRPGTVGQSATFDASNATDPDGEIVEYRWDFDGNGTIDANTSSATTPHAYEQAGVYAPRVTVVDDDDATAVAETSYDVREPRPEPQAQCSVDPTTVAPGETVTIDASESANTETIDYDPDGDGTYERREQTSFALDWTYNETGNFTSRVRVRAGDQTDTADCGAVTVSAPDEGIPWLPIGAGVAGLLGLGGLSWYVLRGRGKSPGGSGSGSGGGGGGDERPRRPRKPRTPSSSEQRPVRYETGVFELPRTSGPITVEVGFEPDLVLLEATNGARTDSAVDRTAGWSRGLARVADGTTQYAVTVADDSQSTDQATYAVSDTRALELLRHESDGAPGRVALTVADTTDDGFEVDVSVPGDDPLAGGIRVLYQAFATPSEVDVEIGFFETPTEPGTQTVQFGFEADHVSLTASAAVFDTDQLWTTNCGVGLSVGNAVYDESADQTVWGTSAWPQREASTAGVCRTDRVLHLLYQDADRIAGRTSASVTDLGSTMRLRYDRVYNGPQKLGSTARHPVSYLAMAGGEKMRPTVGAVSFPDSGEVVSVDCGFEPAMVELYVSDAAIGEEAVGTGARPFDVSYGTAIDTGDGLRQYVVHHSMVADPPAARSDVPAGEATGTGETAADGGNRQGLSNTGTGPDPAGGDVSGGDDIGDVPAGDAVGDVPTADVPSADPTAGTEPGESQTAPDPKATPDDGRAGLWLAQASDGTIVGRDELRVQQLTSSGFDLTVESVDTDGRSGGESRPTVVYRAWPAVDGERGSDSPDEETNDSGGSGPSQPDRNGTPGSAEESASGGASPGNSQEEQRR